MIRRMKSQWPPVVAWLSGYLALWPVFGMHARAASSAGTSWERPSMAAHTKRASYLELGPMIGHTSSTDTRIWARASGAARLSVRVGARADLSDGRNINGPRLESSSGFMGQVFVNQLKASQRYYYCVLLDGREVMSPPYPFFVTAPPEGTRGRVRFAFTSCVGYHGYDASPGYADMASRTNIDLLLRLGDN